MIMTLNLKNNVTYISRLASWGRGQRWSSKRWFSQHSTIWPGL